MVPEVLPNAGYGSVLLGLQTFCHHQDAQLEPIIFFLYFLLVVVYVRRQTFNLQAFIQKVYVLLEYLAQPTVKIGS